MTFRVENPLGGPDDDRAVTSLHGPAPGEGACYQGLIVVNPGVRSIEQRSNATAPAGDADPPRVLARSQRQR